MKRFTILTLSAATLLAAACTKTKEQDPQPKSAEQLLSANVWHMSGLTADPGVPAGNGTVVTNLYSFIPSCTQNDTQEFVAGGQFKQDEGPTKCDPNDPQTVIGTWSFITASAGNSVNVIVNGNQLRFKILELSATQLKLSTTDDVFGVGTGNSVTYTLIYSK